MDLTSFDAMLKEHFSEQAIAGVEYCDSPLPFPPWGDPIGELLGPLLLPADWSPEFIALVEDERDYDVDDMTPEQDAELDAWNLEQGRAWSLELARRKGLVASGQATLEKRDWGIAPEWLAHRKREQERWQSQYLAAAERVRLAQATEGVQPFGLDAA